MTLTLVPLIWLGTLTFAAMGAIAGVRRHLDLVGVIVVASVTAVGGGSVRDVVSGQLPPGIFRQDALLTAVVATAVAVFLLRHRLPEDGTLLWALDTLGLALFAALGAQAGIAAGFGVWGTLFTGAVSGIGGGMIRDVLVGQVPSVLTEHRDLYASAAVAGAAVVLAGDRLGLPYDDAALAGAVAAFALRAASRWLGLSVPRA